MPHAHHKTRIQNKRIKELAMLTKILLAYRKIRISTSRFTPRLRSSLHSYTSCTSISARQCWYTSSWLSRSNVVCNFEIPVKRWGVTHTSHKKANPLTARFLRHQFSFPVGVRLVYGMGEELGCLYVSSRSYYLNGTKLQWWNDYELFDSHGDIFVVNGSGIPCPRSPRFQALKSNVAFDRHSGIIHGDSW